MFPNFGMHTFYMSTKGTFVFCLVGAQFAGEKIPSMVMHIFYVRTKITPVLCLESALLTIVKSDLRLFHADFQCIAPFSAKQQLKAPQKWST